MVSKGGKATAATSGTTVTQRVVPKKGIPASRTGTGTATASAGPESGEDVSTADREETVLFCIDKNGNCKIGLPPAAEGDNYNRRAMDLGKLENVSHVFFNPKGEMFAVRGHELYKGPTPSAPWNDWFQLAKCVGRGDWDQFKHILFSPGGVLYGVTSKEGLLVSGPEPTNPHVSWLHKCTTTHGKPWTFGEAFLFDQEDTLYVYWSLILTKVIRVKSIKTVFDISKIETIVLGLTDHPLFLGFSYEGDLWFASKDGIMYSGPPPVSGEGYWKGKAKKMGSNFHIYKHMNFTHDRTIQKVLSVDFLVDTGEILDRVPHLVAQQDFDNKSSSVTMKDTFEVDDTVIAESQFSHGHGFEIGIEAETTFTAKIPLVAEASVRVAVNTSTSHTWNLTDINRIETHYKLSSSIEVPPGKAIRKKAVVKKATMAVPYIAVVLTRFGYKTTVTGVWKGACFFNLRIRQEDI